MVTHTPCSEQTPTLEGKVQGMQAPFSAFQRGGEFESPHGMEYRAGMAYTGTLRGKTSQYRALIITSLLGSACG